MATFDYTGRYAYHIIVVTSRREPVLTGSLAERTSAALVGAAARTHFDLLAYVVMPDHLHALVAGNEETSHLVRFVQQFKQRTGYEFRRSYGSELWQRSYFDHVVRSDENLAAIANYIAANPVRAGLAVTQTEWPYSGGSVIFRDRGAKAPPLRCREPSGEPRRAEARR